jgi:hypothetical protein
MTLLMGDEFTDRRERKLLLKTFRFLTGQLGIDNKNFTVLLRKRCLDDDDAVGFRKEEGHHAGGMVTKIQGSSEYYMILNSDLPVQLLVTALSHEMVHVKQMETGELELLNTLDDSAAVMWHGITYPFSKKLTEQEYKEQPWEKEALAKMHKLASDVLHFYDLDDLAYIDSRLKAEERTNKNDHA